MASHDETLLETLSDLVSRPDAEIDLPSAALVLAQVEYPDLDIGLHRAALRGLGHDAAAMLSHRPAETVEEVTRVVFGEMGFRGNRDDYTDPRNSFLNDVLERRVGIPISLAVVYIEIAEACGRETEAVGFPGHFLVRDRASGSVLDPFHRGAVVDQHTCRRLLAANRIPLSQWRDEYLAAVDKLDVLTRMIANLVRVYGDRGRADRVSTFTALAAKLGELRDAGDAQPLQ